VAAGYVVCSYDADPAARERFARESGVATVGSPVEAAAGARAVVLMLPDSSVVGRVLLADGLLASAAPGALVVDMGSSDPVRSRELAAVAAQRGVGFVDAPVSGGVRGAVAGTLAVMAGGSEADVAAVMPLLGVLGGKVLHVGPVGCGHALKALNNLLSATSLLASAEALRAGRRFGIDPNVLLDTINGSTGRSYSTEVKLPQYVLSGTFDSGFALRLMVKDVGIALGVAEAAQAPMRLGERTAALWREAASTLPDGADHTEIARWLDEELERP